MARGLKIWGDELRRIREERFYSQAEFAQLLGMGPRNLYRLENTFVVGMSQEAFRNLAGLLKATPEGLASRLVVPPEKVKEIGPPGKNGKWPTGAATAKKNGVPAAAVEEEDFDNNVEPYSEEKVPEIPLFELSVAAGEWADVSDVAEVHQPGQIDHGRFRIHISGDSMTPEYPSGIVVEFHCLREGRDALEVGKDYYVQREDGRATFKRLEKIDEQRLVFRALNRKKYRLPMPVARRDIVRMARAVFKGQMV